MRQWAVWKGVFSARFASLAAHATMDTVTEERCSLCGPCLAIISRTILERIQLSWVKWSEVVGWWVSEMLRFIPCEHGSHRKHLFRCIVQKECLPSHFLEIQVYCCDADHIENTFTVLLTACVCWTVYRAVACQCFDNIRYHIYKMGVKGKLN
jgi:hypothetical protein